MRNPAPGTNCTSRADRQVSANGDPGRAAVRGTLTLLFRLAINADTRPGYRLEPRRRDLVFAFHADSVGALVDSMDGFVYSSKEFGICLLQRESDMKIAFLTGLVDPVAAL